MDGKKKRGKVLHAEVREIIFNVNKYFLNEEFRKKSQTPTVTGHAKTSAATGVSVATIKRIRVEGEDMKEKGLKKFSSPRPRNRSKKIRQFQVDDIDICVIRRIIMDYYIEKKGSPTLAQLRTAVLKKYNITKENFRQIVHFINFQFKKCTVSRRVILIEKPDITFWRYKYLMTLKQARADGRPIVFTDEAWVNRNLTFGKCWKKDPHMNLKTTLIVLQAASSEGVLSGTELIYRTWTEESDFHGDLSFDNFEKWVLQILVPNLQPRSIICMHDAPYNNKKARINLYPGKYDRKEVMKNWLDSYGVLYDPNMPKSDLYDLVVKHAPKSISYKNIIDDLLMSLGHEVCRLPPNHCDLNVIEYLWSDLKRYIKENDTRTQDINCAPKMVSSSAIMTWMNEAVAKGVGAIEWKKYWQQVEELETEYLGKDFLVDEIIDTLIKKVSENDSIESDLSGMSDSDSSDSSTI